MPTGSLRAVLGAGVVACMVAAGCGDTSGPGGSNTPSTVDIAGSWKSAVPPVIMPSAAGPDTLVPDTLRLSLDLSVSGGESLFVFASRDSTGAAMFANQGAWSESTLTILVLHPTACQVAGTATPQAQDSVCRKPMFMRIVSRDSLKIDIGNMRNPMAMMGLNLDSVLATPGIGPVISAVSVVFTRTP